MKRKEKRYGPYVIKPGTRYHANDFLNLRKEIFGTWGEYAEQKFEWMFEKNPYIDYTPLVIVEYKGEMVGARGYFALRMSYNNEKYIGLQSGSLMIDPSHRGKGLFKKMNEVGIDNFGNESTVFFSFPGNAAQGGYLKYGWSAVSNPVYFRLLSINNPPDMSILDQLCANMSSVIGNLSINNLINHLRNGNHYQVKDYDIPPISTLESLYNKEIPEGLHAARDREFYSWRLQDPTENFTVHMASSNSEETGALITSKYNDSILIRDVLPFDIKNSCFSVLVQQAIKSYPESKYIRIWAPSSFNKSKLLKSGFTPSKIVPFKIISKKIVTKQHQNDSLSTKTLTDSKNWDLHLIERDY